MNECQQRILESIERAFRNVELGSGVSLHETTVIDDYGTAKQRRTARAADEKHDWRKLTDDPDLTRLCGIGYSGLCFFDAAGLRFHLPACLSRAVKEPECDDVGDMLESLMFQLTKLDEFQRGRSAILDAAQRRCVRDAMVYLREVLALDDAELNHAIEGYWSQDA